VHYNYHAQFDRGSFPVGATKGDFRTGATQWRDIQMAMSETTRQMIPVYVEQREGQDVRDVLYVKNENGSFQSLRQVQAAYGTEESKEIPGIITTNLIETGDAELGTTFRSVSVSPYQVCCVYINGYKICFLC